MKIIPRALSAGLALAAVPAQAFVTYQDIVSAATNPDDLSRQALVTIFGDVVTNPLTASSNTIIGNLFMVFNAIIATMGIVWFLFIGIRHAVRTGHQGSVFNNGRDVVGILSVVSGFLMIVPTASGWSLAQLVMLWGASIMGIELSIGLFIMGSIAPYESTMLTSFFRASCSATALSPIRLSARFWANSFRTFSSTTPQGSVLK